MRATTDLVLYKRHRTQCPVLKMDDLTDDAKRYYMECGCPIWVFGRTPNGHFVPRQTTGTANQKEAEGKVQVIVAKSNAIARAETVKTMHDPALGPTVADCAERYLAARRHELGEKTYGQHKLLLDRLEAY